MKKIKLYHDILIVFQQFIIKIIYVIVIQFFIFCIKRIIHITDKCKNRREKLNED